MAVDVFDAVVVGAGFGGLGAAVGLASDGARVHLAETLAYPGGCASTFARGGYRFDAGATLVSGLGAGQLFGRWGAASPEPFAVDWLDPLVELRAPGLSLPTGARRGSLLERFAVLDGAPREALARFFQFQARVAEPLWALFDDAHLLPPLSARALLAHAGRVGAYAPLASVVGRSLGSVLARFGLAGFAPLRLWADAVCQITVQCAADAAEAPFALAALDYFYRGTGHVRGGVGALARSAVALARAHGADVVLANRVAGVTRDRGGWFEVDTRRGVVRARAVVANLVPDAAARVFGPALSPRGRARLARLGSKVASGWGAAMLYLGLEAEGLRPEPHHLELVDDAEAPLLEGNHVFVSVAGAEETDRAPRGARPATVSTHVPLPGAGSGRPHVPAEDAAYVSRVHAAMRATIARRAPEIASRIRVELTASPRTFARFTGRPEGAVGGVPRRVGLDGYGALGPVEVERGLWLVGDSVFPGQSALATAVGGLRTAAALRARL